MTADDQPELSERDQHRADDLRRWAKYERRQARLVYTLAAVTREAMDRYAEDCRDWADHFTRLADEIEAGS